MLGSHSKILGWIRRTRCSLTCSVGYTAYTVTHASCALRTLRLCRSNVKRPDDTQRPSRRILRGDLGTDPLRIGADIQVSTTHARANDLHPRLLTCIFAHALSNEATTLSLLSLALFSDLLDLIIDICDLLDP